ncbi:MAG: Z1 domain-containing protein [Ignavibacteria bacterium]|nr:Z1 domain-containing protein [Ignavibacteria bacterium]
MIITPYTLETIVRIIQDSALLYNIDIYSIPEDKVDEIIKKGLNNAQINVSSEDYKKIKKEFEYKCHIQQNEGVSIVDDYYEHRDWYSLRCEQEGFSEFFWKRYRDYLIREVKLNINVVNNLDNSTLKDLMNYLGDPTSAAPFFRRGLVIGDVQSGKTSTYTGLISKAADAGYKIVILLTGVTETLRSQTQKRIESGIIGISITGLKDKNRAKIVKRVGVGKNGGPIKVTAMTSIEYDFIGSSDQITTSLANHQLVMFIVKKNTKVLGKLYSWLYNMNVESNDKKIHYPMLMIDDEADNASINTNKEEEDPTKTNEIIRKLANVFTQTTYIGFTATPYANVFINPDTTEEMLNDDLFPKNFIYALQAPSNYIGASKIFGKDAQYANSLVWIQDIEEPVDLDNYNKEHNFYYKHKKEWTGELPNSLKISVYCFFLANVVRDLRGDSLEPRTMMINISRFVKVQKYIKEKIEILFNDVYDEIETNFSDNAEKNKFLTLYSELKECWDIQYSKINIKWDDVCKKKILIKAIQNIEVLVINSGKNTGKLDYEKNPHLRAIAIGGLALSRGLTLEGLLVSYFYRNTSTYDVLMQMGRWFGYRKNYEDLFRIWTSKKSAIWYNEIAENTEDLKKDIYRMRESKLTPEHFGLRVRNDSDELQITAHNKMRLAADHFEQISYWGSVFDTPYIDSDINKIVKNIELTKQFIERLYTNGYHFKREDEIAKGLYLCKNVPEERIVKLLRHLKISPFNLKFDTSQIIDFLENTNEDVLTNWDVVLIEGSREGNINHNPIKLNNGITLVPIRRSFDLSKNKINIGGKSGRLTSPTDARNGLSKKQIEEAKRKAEIADDWNGRSRTLRQEVWFKHVPDRNPLLMIYFIDLKDDGLGITEQLFVDKLKGSPVMGYSVGFPMSKNSYATEFHKYKVNLIYARQEYDENLNESIEE